MSWAACRSCPARSRKTFSKMQIRNARISDAEEIIALIGTFAVRDLMLPITQDFLFEHISNYYVAEVDHRVVGVVFLRIYNSLLAEVRSLAVADSFQKKGLGAALVRHLVVEAEKLGIKRLFALSVTPSFFRKIGFQDADRNEFPEKIWLDCVHCPKKDNCDELSLVYEISRS